jgi:dihydrolipoamide dehydrogenase
MALIRDEPDGFVKVVTDTESGDLLGVHILGAGADEVIGQGGRARWLDASGRWNMALVANTFPR